MSVLNWSLPIKSSLRLVFGVYLVSAALAFSQSIPNKHCITHEDVWLMKRVGAPVPSPDGKWVVFSVTEPAYSEKEQASDLWIVPADGSIKPRQITHSSGTETGLSWSPDSRKLVFTAKREGDE